MTKRRVADKATPEAQAPGRAADASSRDLDEAVKVRDAVRAGGLLRFIPKELAA